MKVESHRRWDAECTLVGQIAAGISLLTLLVFLQRHELLLYGDAVAHTNIARRIFDSRTPGILQLGTVWLPLPHLLILPFIVSDVAWRSGIGGAIPSMVAYVLGTIAIFRLVRESLTYDEKPKAYARIAAWAAALVYAANPNLIYMQVTAMTEPLYLAWFLWALVHFNEFIQQVQAANIDQAHKSLLKCGLCVAGATLTRYDGWFLAAVLCLACAVVIMGTSQRKALLSPLLKFASIVIAGPALWLVYNHIIYGDALEFSRGPYSAQAIQQRVVLSGFPAYPGLRNPLVALLYFFKAAQQIMADGQLQKIWTLCLLAGVILLLTLHRHRWPLLFLLLPIPFYMLSISYGSVPVCFPEWWPFSYYNVRFGLELLPAFAVFAGIFLHWALFAASKPGIRSGVGCAAIFLIAGSYAFVWRSQPICFREAQANSRSRLALETELASTLLRIPAESTILMYLGDHVGALQDAGIPLRRTINEGNHRPWKRPDDPEGLWERALADPKQYADAVITIGDDPVAKRVSRQDLTSVAVIRTNGQPPATVYWTHPVR
ncbi:MAG TPA: hypothetical protein VF753_07575 [Terriglobales bacterium]